MPSARGSSVRLSVTLLINQGKLHILAHFIKTSTPKSEKKRGRISIRHVCWIWITPTSDRCWTLKDMIMSWHRQTFCYSMSWRHADIWSHSGHYLVDPYSWPWSPNGHGHGQEWLTPCPLVLCQSALPFRDIIISKFDHENPWQSQVCGQRSRSHLTLKIQRSRSWPRSNTLVTFEAWILIHMVAIHFEAIRPLLAEI